MKRYILILLLALALSSLSVHATMVPHNNDKVNKKAEEIFAQYENAAKLMNPEAIANLAFCYLVGKGVKKNEKKAAELYEEAAKLNDLNAQTNIGICYLTGIGVNKDLSKAVFWLTKAADRGELMAQVRLGYCYKQGYGIAKDEKKAFALFEKAAIQGNPEAQNNLGNCYISGIAVETNAKKAVIWFTKSANKGCGGAQYNLGYCYENGIGVDKKDDKKAFGWYQKAAEQGNIKAQISLGLYYLYGKVIQRDIPEAQRWFKAANDNPELQEPQLSTIKRLVVQLVNLPDCPICLSPMLLQNDLSYAGCCARVFHTQCLEQWLHPQHEKSQWWQCWRKIQRKAPDHNTCPMCRAFDPGAHSFQDLTQAAPEKQATQVND